MSECENCAHSLEPVEMPDPADPSKTLKEKGHKDVGGNLVCLQCGEVCKLATALPAPVPAAAATTAPPVVTAPDVKHLAENVAKKMSELRDELIWKNLQSPGVVIQLVDGGYIIDSRFGETAVRVGLDEALAKAKEWLVPRV